MSLILAVLAICAVTSTAAGRRDVRTKLRPLTLPLAAATALIWAIVLLWR